MVRRSIRPVLAPQRYAERRAEEEPAAANVANDAMSPYARFMDDLRALEVERTNAGEDVYADYLVSLRAFRAAEVSAILWATLHRWRQGTHWGDCIARRDVRGSEPVMRIVCTRPALEGAALLACLTRPLPEWHRMAHQQRLWRRPTNSQLWLQLQ